ncbi:MAG: hypothetical protein A2700_03070 [Candidatus Blackburnbacteria bacterium RIFCSPHIGHO2_01_FULL_44_64]|uniref:Phenylacetate-CoA ligase n=2 Tax=Patescibacteria group TaxID=1783273 RepID=A0A0G1MMW5_9BACT|nr:MAG: Phenylacetate-CoA ligase [Candidatus Azambacteria bacterium GW2011_GWA1_44_9]OGY08316.1 MAG: hypothetical protein A2700_03070 [Candidatus Blackburnbacteria bacterium RIFCSPHIGHO2_01_FULL_44_64]OGY12116.1 MAG: hypothetical protein A3E16_00155 [Candidatus Blackburnbacteria bacterium RIFCSPHIGHO2_12_FULL_44_25]OGY13733.1 MAG: hypothetical protein A3A62_02880 [Candidatus Blackburnbacteria bacterium RIFCSPLOWO2_01_FULL_44_43]OGY16428.1 MAG: hypothetical protein A3H88_00810 [Candidatus Blackb
MSSQSSTILSNLNKTIMSAKRTRLYKDKNLHKINSISELSGLPFTTKEDLRGAYPYGGLAVSEDKIIEVHTTSGTTGKPTLSFLTRKDLNESSKAISEAWRAFGITKNSKVMFIMSYGLFSGAALNTYAIQSIGAFVLPAGIQPVKTQVDFMVEFGIDTVIATPGFLLYLYEWMAANDFDRSRLKLVRAIAAGEVYSNKIRREIEKKLKIKVFDHYGLCEVNTGIAYECDKMQGLHVIDDYVVPEIVDPETGKVMPEGEYGELVLTSLKKDASPIVRYKTKDITRIIPGKCPCGRHRIRIDRIKARVGETLFIKGIKIDPYELRDFIREYLGKSFFGGDMQIVVKDNDIKFLPKIFLSLVQNDEKIIKSLTEKIYEQTRTRFIVEHADPQFFNREKNNKVKFIHHE